MHMGHNTYLVFVIDAFHILNSLTHGNNKIFNLTKYTENKKTKTESEKQSMSFMWKIPPGGLA